MFAVNQTPATPTVDIDPVQLIAPDGAPTDESRFSHELPPETLCWLYEMMVVTRELDTEFVNLQRQGELALFPSCRGQEAAQVGRRRPAYARRTGCSRSTGNWESSWSVVLRPATSVRSGGARWHGGIDFTEKCCAPVSIPIGTQALHAVGAAMAAERLGEDSITVAFLGDGATSEGDVHEAMNFAAVFRAPCVFFVQNNQWAISVPLAKQTAALSIAHKAIGYGMPGIRVDGNDLLACYAVMSQAAERARAGGGPTLIEAVTYRMGPHTTSDDPTRYRPAAEVDKWAALDPDPALPALPRRVGLWSERLDERVAARAKRMCAELRDAVFDAPDIDIDEVFTTVYAEIDARAAGAASPAAG